VVHPPNPGPLDAARRRDRPYASGPPAQQRHRAAASGSGGPALRTTGVRTASVRRGRLQCRPSGNAYLGHDLADAPTQGRRCIEWCFYDDVSFPASCRRPTQLRPVVASDQCGPAIIMSEDERQRPVVQQKASAEMLETIGGDCIEQWVETCSETGRGFARPREPSASYTSRLVRARSSGRSGDGRMEDTNEVGVILLRTLRRILPHPCQA
jgi:hypothetical protein